MVIRSDFRRAVFATQRVESSGRSIGRREYWKLYTIENVLRVVIHSILKDQFPGPNWWTAAVDTKIQNRVSSIKADYATQPTHTTPGRHEIYYVFLRDLIEIMRVNRKQILPAIADLDQWLVRLERIRLSRNVVGHMNWLRGSDSRRVARLHEDLVRLVDQLAEDGIDLEVP